MLNNNGKTYTDDVIDVLSFTTVVTSKCTHKINKNDIHKYKTRSTKNYICQVWILVLKTGEKKNGGVRILNDINCLDK